MRVEFFILIHHQTLDKIYDFCRKKERKKKKQPHKTPIDLLETSLTLKHSHFFSSVQVLAADMGSTVTMRDPK